MLHTEKLVYFVRHGESAANTASIFQTADDALTERGHKQVALVAARFATLPFDALLSSPFPRAHHTALAISAATSKPVEVTELFREYVPPSSLHNRSRDSEEGQHYMRLRKEHLADPSWHYEDEENYFDLHERAGSALTWLYERSEKTFVVTTHLGFLKAIVAHMLGQGVPDADTYVRMRFLLESVNTGITIVRYGSDKKHRTGWRLVSWNDFSHLPEDLVGVRDHVGVM